MDLVEPDITQMAHAMAQFLGPVPVGWCAIASVALWHFWHSTTQERLMFCIAFQDHAAHHVYLRRGNILVDPSGHQFQTHTAHCYAVVHESQKQPHHRNTLETCCPDEFMALLGNVGWPIHQWPTRTKVGKLVDALRPLQRATVSPEHVAN